MLPHFTTADEVREGAKVLSRMLDPTGYDCRVYPMITRVPQDFRGGKPATRVKIEVIGKEYLGCEAVGFPFLLRTAPKLKIIGYP